MESNSHLNDIQINKIFDQRNNLINNFKLFEKKSLSKKKTEIELFRFGFNFFKSQMDIVNFINIFILTQIMLTHQTETKHNVLNQTIELSIN